MTGGRNLTALDIALHSNDMTFIRGTFLAVDQVLELRKGYFRRIFNGLIADIANQSASTFDAVLEGALKIMIANNQSWNFQ